MINIKINQKNTKLYRINQLLQKIYQKLPIENRDVNKYYQKKTKILLKRSNTNDI